jgi:hypothetical protein
MGVAPLDYGPVLLRKPFGFRLAADTLPSGCPRGQSSTVGASPWLYPSFPTSCPFRVRHGRVPQPTRRYPRLWIRRPSFERRRDLNPPDQNAAQHTLRACPPPQAARPVPRGSPVGVSLPTAGASRVAWVSRVPSCRCHYPGGIVGSDRSWDGLFHPFPCSPTTTAFPVMLAGRLPHHRFRGLLSIHSRYGLMTRCTAERYIGLEGSDGFVTSTVAPIASGRSDRVGRAGLAPAG